MSSHPRETRDKSFNVLFTVEEHGELMDAAAYSRTSAGQFIRDAIRYRIAMDLHDTPTCASGKPCLIPHMHPQRPPQAQAPHYSATPYQTRQQAMQPPQPPPLEAETACMAVTPDGARCGLPVAVIDPTRGYTLCQAHAHLATPRPGALEPPGGDAA